MVVLFLLTTTGTQNQPLDVEGWHRTLRALRDTAQPDAERVTDEKLAADNSERNVRVLHPPGRETSGGKPGNERATGRGHASSGT